MALAFLIWVSTFPSMNTPEAMIEPLAYIASQDEMDDLTTRGEDQKQRSMNSG